MLAVSGKDVRNAVAVLPFVRRNEHGKYCYWSVQPTGNWEVDCQTGKEYAQQAIEILSAEDKPYTLQWIVAAMKTGGGESGIEVGFFNELFNLAARGLEAA